MKKIIKNKTKLIQNKTEMQSYINEDGKEILIETSKVYKYSDFGFTKVWMDDFFKSLLKFTKGEQKIKILSYILKEMKHDNTVLIFQKKLAEDLNIQKSVVSKVIKELRELEIIVSTDVKQVYMVNPQLISKTTPERRKQLLTVFKCYQEANTRKK